jgi:protein involved in polysaccharide export with SLBB domain
MRSTSQWVKQKRLNVGDEIRVKVVEARSVDGPARKRRVHPAEKLNAKKRYVRMMAKELGWRFSRN